MRKCQGLFVLGQDMATRLILVRHGETLWNAQKRYCGSTDIGLSAKGKKQARRLKEKLNGVSIHKIYTSGRKRAIQTAKIIFQGAKINNMPDLNEMHFGIFEGLTYREIMKKYPKIYSAWLEKPLCVTIPESESLASFRKRVTRALKKIVSVNKNKTVAVVCHGGPISAFVTVILKINDFWKYIPHSASISIIEYRNGSLKIKTLNDITHLN